MMNKSNACVTLTLYRATRSMSWAHLGRIELGREDAINERERGAAGKKDPVFEGAVVAGERPDPRLAVVARGDQAVAIRAECHGVNLPPMIERQRDGLSRRDLPDPRGLVIACRDHPRTVRTERYCIDLALMIQRRSHRLARRCIPDPRRIVLAPRDHARAVRAERRGAHWTLM